MKKHIHRHGKSHFWADASLVEVRLCWQGVCLLFWLMSEIPISDLSSQPIALRCCSHFPSSQGRATQGHAQSSPTSLLEVLLATSICSRLGWVGGWPGPWAVQAGLAALGLAKGEARKVPFSFFFSFWEEGDVWLLPWGTLAMTMPTAFVGWMYLLIFRWGGVGWIGSNSSVLVFVCDPNLAVTLKLFVLRGFLWDPIGNPMGWDGCGTSCTCIATRCFNLIFWNF